MRPRLLFIYLQPSSFVREDLRILGEKYDLVPFQFGGSGKLGLFSLARLTIKELLWLVREMPRAAGVYGWFADYHMVLPVLFARMRRKSVAVAVGGFDAIALPSLDYGIFLSSWRRPLARLVLRLADVLLPVSPSLVQSTNQFSEWPEVTDQGLQAFIPDLRTPIHVVPTGYDPDLWTMGPASREPLVSTVAMIDSDRTLRRKGVDLLFQTARLMPEVRFRVLGVQDVQSITRRYAPPPNVELIGRLPREELVAYYQATSVYLQLSRAEGLPNVLCEAMLCGCIPVGSRVFGIPDGIGDAGFVVEEPDPEQIREAIGRALSSGAERREAARRHIEQHFHIELRQNRLQEIMSRMLTNDPGRNAS